MNKMEETRVQLVQKILEAIDGQQEDTDSSHTELVEGATNKELTERELETQVFEEVVPFFNYLPDKFWPKSSNRSFSTLVDAEDAIKEEFFLAECDTFSEAERNEKYLNRQDYLAKLSVYALDFSNQIYKKTIKDLETYKDVRIGGMCLKGDIIVNFDVYKVMAQKMITDIALKLMSMEIQALNSLVMLPVQLAHEPLYRQKEVKRLLQLVNPKYDFEAEIRRNRCSPQ